MSFSEREGRVAPSEVNNDLSSTIAFPEFLGLTSHYSFIIDFSYLHNFIICAWIKFSYSAFIISFLMWLLVFNALRFMKSIVLILIICAEINLRNSLWNTFVFLLSLSFLLLGATVALHSEFIPGRLGGLYWMSGNKPRSAWYKANTLFTLLSLCPYNLCLLNWKK